MARKRESVYTDLVLVKHPDEELPAGVNLAPMLQSGVTIGTLTSIADDAGVLTITEASAPAADWTFEEIHSDGVTRTTHTVEASEGVTFLVGKQGVDGTEYDVRISFVDSDGYDRVVLQKIRVEG